MDILVVDDNFLMQQIALKYFTSLGYTVTVASSAKEATDQAREQTPGLLFIDVHLPDADGFEALQALRNISGCETVPAVCISGLQVEDTRKMASASFDLYLTKPIDLDLLGDTAQRYLQRP